MVCTSQTLAAQAGLDILKKGGNAVDAAIATAISLTVLEPPSNGIGSDLFALIWYHGKLYGLNGSGPAPLKLTREAVLEKIAKTNGSMAVETGTGEIASLSASAMPDKGWETVTVPGAPASWKEMHRKFGAADFEDLFDD
jgi:gamma-glutamyltranspeptidase/glutathione hydrolase